jgi:hypothetical protein
MFSTSHVSHWPSFSLTWGKYPRWGVGGSNVRLGPRSQKLGSSIGIVEFVSDESVQVVRSAWDLVLG